MRRRFSPATFAVLCIAAAPPALAETPVATAIFKCQGGKSIDATFYASLDVRGQPVLGNHSDHHVALRSPGKGCSGPSKAEQHRKEKHLHEAGSCFPPP